MELNKERGQRLKSLLAERGMTQKEFAEKIGYCKEQVSMMVNGRRNLTEETARLTKERVFPDIRVEWLLGYDNYMTDVNFEFAIEMREEKKAIQQDFNVHIRFLPLFEGSEFAFEQYEKKVAPVTEEEKFFHYGRKEKGFLIKQNETVVGRIEEDSCFLLFDELKEYAVWRIKCYLREVECFGKSTGTKK